MATLSSLLHLLGEDLAISTTPRDSGIDSSLIHERRKLSPSERLEYARAFGDFVIENSPKRVRTPAPT